VAGVSLGEDYSFEKSINADLSMTQINPFAHLSIFSITDSGFSRGSASNFLLKMKRRKYFES
jgi:hypothetical protein